jgi:4-amino-4-deoxy-L-arabinose transferase-like glycosyltransferase
LKPTTRNLLLLFATCVGFNVAGTWIIPLIDRDEPRFSEASREMIERHDYVVPYFNDEYRFDKPPFTYWAQVASYRVFGQNDFAARFPSAIAAALTALSIFAWGRRIADERVGFWSAIVFTLSFQVIEHAKAAVADMWLVLFVTLAHWAGYELIFGGTRAVVSPTSDLGRDGARPSMRWWFAFYLALAFAFLAKGPIGWTPLLTVTSTIIFLREPQLFRRFKLVRGILLTLAIVCLWGIPALVQTRGQFWEIGMGRHVFERSFSALGGHGAKSLGVYLLLLPLYFVTVFLSFFPWSLKLPWLFKEMRARRDKIDIYLLSGIGVVFIIFTFVTTKLLHYTLPAFPLLALLFVKRWFGANMSILFLKRSALVFSAVCLVLVLFVSPFIGRFFPSRELFRQARDFLKPEMKFAAVDYKEPSLVWYFRSRVHGFMRTWAMDADSAQEFLEEEGPRFLVMPTKLANEIYPSPPPTWKTFSTRGFNAVKGKRSDLTLILKPD